MTTDEAIEQFGLPASQPSRDAICSLLGAELERERSEEGDQELLRALCAQLFSIGKVEDSLLIWEAKGCNFDAMCGIDVQFLCGAGLQPTKDFLAASNDPSASNALWYLTK